MLRLVTGRPGTIRLNVYDEDGIAVDPDSAPTVTILNGAGVEVATGTADETAVTGLWTFIVDSDVTVDLDEYVVTWEYDLATVAQSSETRFEVCGGHLFEIPELRAKESSLQDVDLYTADEIRKRRIQAEQRFEKVAQRAFVHRARRDRLEGKGRPRLVLKDVDVKELLAVEVDGVAYDPADVEIHDGVGVLEHPYLWSEGSTIDVFYIYGMDSTPEPVRDAVITLAIEYLVPSGLPARATSQSTDLGEFRVSVAGRDGSTGIPEVDAVANEFGVRRPGIG